MSSLKRNGELRWKPSYLRRQGHMTKAQKRNYRRLWPKYGIELGYGSRIRPDVIFVQQAPLHLEIGFGKGETLIHRAKNEPNNNFIGIEVHKPAIASVLEQIDQHQLNNVVLVKKDALLFLADHLTQANIHEVWLFFPNPWSNKEKERRIIRPQTLHLIEPHLINGAHLYIATDIKDYAEAAFETLNKEINWTNQSGNQKFSDRPSWRQVSKYEQKGTEAGRRSIDLHFQYQVQDNQKDL